MIELFSRDDQAYFGNTLGIQNLQAEFNRLDRAVRKLSELDDDHVGEADVTNHLEEAEQVLSDTKIFEKLVVQRSRAYARQSQMIEGGDGASFPERAKPKVAEYSIRKTYGELLDLLDRSFRRTNPLFALPIYNPLSYAKDDEANLDQMALGRQRQVVSLLRTQFLKRFESSVSAFEISCLRLLKKIMAFVEVHADSDAEKRRYERWKQQNASVIAETSNRQLDLFSEEEPEEDADFLDGRLIDEWEDKKLDPDEYEVGVMLDEAFLDLDQITKFITETRKFDPSHDDKLKKLIRLLKSKDLANQKVLVFTEFSDTANYLFTQLSEHGIERWKRSMAVAARTVSTFSNGLLRITTRATLPKPPRDAVKSRF